jgi:hypothetical protein
VKFLIDHIQSQMSVDNATLTINTSGLAANIDYVSWDGTDEDGEIQYNDRVVQKVQFNDPSPYQTYLNQWLTAAAAGTPALTTGQAQAIKLNFAKALFDIKRTSPIAYTVSAGAYSWDCTDESQGAMCMAASAGVTTSTTITEFNNALLGMQNQLNGNTDTIVANMANVGIHWPIGWWGVSIYTLAATSDFYSALIAPLNTAFLNLTNSINGWMSGVNGATWPTLSHPTYPTFSTIGYVSVPNTLPLAASVNASLKSLVDQFNANIVAHVNNYTNPQHGTAAVLPNNQTAWTPIGLVSPVGLSGPEWTGLLSAITSRRLSLLQSWLAIQNSLNALASVAAVVSFDVTIGWPF